MFLSFFSSQFNNPIRGNDTFYITYEDPIFCMEHFYVNIGPSMKCNLFISNKSDTLFKFHCQDEDIKTPVHSELSEKIIWITHADKSICLTVTEAINEEEKPLVSRLNRLIDVKPSVEVYLTIRQYDPSDPVALNSLWFAKVLNAEEEIVLRNVK